MKKQIKKDMEEICRISEQLQILQFLKGIFVGFLIMLIILILVSLASSLTYNQTQTNQSCHADLCLLEANKSNYTGDSYSYEDNLKDPKCYYNLNFCNIDNNISLNSNSQGVINVLKYVNYQIQNDLIYKDKQIKQKKNTIIFLVGIIIIVMIWNLYLTFRRQKNESQNC